MKFSLNLLKKYFNTTASVAQIVDTLNNAGVEVEDVLDYSEKYKHFSVAFIKEAVPHPDADKLKVCKVATKDGDLQIVCGASNARAGIFVIYAPIGALIPLNGIKLTKAKIRGVESNGMLVSAKEIELGEESEGIVELKNVNENQIGLSIVDFLNLNNAIFEVSITPNRGDVLGIIGIARELQAYGLGTLKQLNVKSYLNIPNNLGINIVSQKMHNSEDNLSDKFYAVKITGLDNSKPSPDWLKNILTENGYNSINCIVDAVNYVAIVYNQPMHAYDYKKLNNPKEIFIDYAQEGTEFLGLDDKPYKLTKNNFVIKIENTIQALAGVLGGKNCACDENTTEILLEVAHFNEVAIAFSKRDVLVNTDSGYRFERGIDKENIEHALNYAINLILEVSNSNSSVDSLSVLNSSKNAKKQSMVVSLEEINSLTGVDLKTKEIEELLAKLNFTIQQKDNNLLITPPSYRNDCTDIGVIVADIIRLYGFNNLPNVELIKDVKTSAKTTTDVYDKVFMAKHSLASLGLQEVINLSFISNYQHQVFFENTEAIKVVNPISEELNTIRLSLIPSLVYNAKLNILKSNINFKLYEVANIYKKDTSSKLVAGGILVGKSLEKTWQNTEKFYNAYDAKQIVASLLEEFGLNSANLEIKQDASVLPSYYHKGKSGYYAFGGSNILAFFGEISPKVLKQLDIKENLVAFEIFLDALPNLKLDRNIKSPIVLSPFTPVVRDFAFLFSNEVKMGDVIRAVKNIDKKRIAEVNIFDIYTGSNITEGFKSVAFSVKIVSFDFTLTESDIESLTKEIISTVANKFNAKLRD